MSASRQDLEHRAAHLLRGRGAETMRPAAFAARMRAATPAPVPSTRQRTAENLDFSLMFFSAVAGESARPDLYHLVQEAARFADTHGFSALWLPERHFHPFGGPYPNPAVLAASLATITSRVRLRAGSVVLPLHQPAHVAETWSMVDNLSAGRVEVAFGSGWNPNDFVLSPDTFAAARDITRERIEAVRRLRATRTAGLDFRDRQPRDVRLGRRQRLRRADHAAGWGPRRHRPEDHAVSPGPPRRRPRSR
jgi:alkanesulfonate monooxygenase SsuD/methylene tetrahydromethanopterin reductase-like flavin-dependent oxidoreductase (luciferase family)